VTGEAEVPPGTVSCVQHPGEIMWFPLDWYHATCALDEWTVGIGAQNGRIIRQNFKELDADHKFTSKETEIALKECLSVDTAPTITTTKTSKIADASQESMKTEEGNWKWFGET
jgi:hypothetical protein